MSKKWSLELSLKPDFDKAMERIYAWYEGEIIDRAPIQFAGIAPLPRSTSTPKAFSATSAFPIGNEKLHLNPEQWKQRWFDAESMIETFEEIAKTIPFQAETFPIFWPNIGPVVYSAFYGTEIIYEETTGWAEPIVHNWSDMDKLVLDTNNEYMRKVDEMTKLALARGKGKYMVGYTDLHPGMDCVAAWRKNEQLCMDLYDNPEQVKKLIDKSIKDWHLIFDRFDSVLKANKQLSATWMGIPSFGKMHIPSCDFSAMISTEHFIEFCLPILQTEVKGMTHNIFHLDGAGVARHLDMILSVPEIHAIQWVQGVGKDQAIMKWVDLIKRIQSAGKSVVVNLQKEELQDFISAVRPNGIFLCLYSVDKKEQLDIIKMIEKWK